ncbi:ABC transporter ATP-binding protein [uncultured Dialister sp.]|jgi:ATP-binding cassette subfamily B multidrug efflux pump|uniref:ABC transporter ATP-binding protein n=1 Tax=uncultured Dialister sp. TaxID=278064 RepID=UPI0025D5D630|nr:ABC transporter ATP-binding protein [uncultured Dialister sp.]
MNPSTHTLKGIILSAAAMGPRLTACLLAVILVSLVLGVLPPLILQQAIDSLTAGSATAKGLLLLGLLYFGLTALSGLADSAKESYITVFGQKVTHHIRTVMAQKLSRLPASYYTTHEGGAVASLFVNDVDTIEDLFDSGIISMAADALKIISILITVFFLSPGLFLLLLMALPLLFLLTRAFQKRMLAAQVENRKAVAGTNEIIPETMHTIRTIRLTGSEEFMERRYGASIRRSFSAMEKTNFYDSIYSPIILTTSAFLIALMCILSVSGTDFTALFGMTAGTAAALIAYVDKVFSPLQSMGMEIENIQSAMAGAHRIREFLGEKEMDIPEESPKETASLPLSISHMTFAYDGDHPLFHDFSLTARAGEKITIAGRTGSGKTTLFKLICGLYEPTEGTITVFGQRPSTIPPEDRRKTFGIVSQSYPMVQGTVRDQITLGDSRITGEDIERALRLAGLYDSCMNLPEKLDTPCTEGLFSQGEFQLLAIARALVFNPPLLLLDEMTASLDSLTEKRVMAALDRASSKRTVLSISHRLYEQQGGRIVWIGKSPAAEKN